jgi:hypothetical protein
MDGPGIPLHLLLIVLVVMPVCIAVALGWISSRGMTPLVFRCRRCEREFRRPPYRAFPTVCPLCGSRSWNASP